MTAAELSAFALVEFFEQLAACPREGAGAWVFEHGEAQLGILLVENGQICWSTLPGRRKRFIEILGQVSGAPREALEATLRSCTETKTPLVEGMTRAGIMSVAQMHAALRLDTLESLWQIAVTPERRGIWRAHKGVGYGASVRFSLTELLVDSAATMLGAPEHDLTASAGKLFGDDADFLFISPDGLPVAASDSVKAMSVPECLALARRADDMTAISTSSIFAGRSPRGPDSVTVIWREGPWLGILETRGTPHIALRKLIGRETRAKRAG